MHHFINREEELKKLDSLAESSTGGLAVIWGRRRIGKTRLLVEWCHRRRGIYTVFDQSAPEVQRAYVAEAIAQKIPGFADVSYPDWRRLLERLAKDAAAAKFRGPIVFDELPYAVVASPDLPSILQRWIDHHARDAGLVVAVSGSSQRMMQSIVLDAQAPLYGRAAASMGIGPLGAEHLPMAFGPLSAVQRLEHWTAWGGIPRYWELAAASSGTVEKQLLELVFHPLGALHLEPERILLEEVPSAVEVRPVLDAIGAGAHRVSEIAGRLGRPATSLGKALDRLIGMGIVRREVPFGEPERSGKRSLYRIDDPFFRLWFRLVAPHRAALVAGTDATRARILKQGFEALLAEAWKDLCRRALPRLPARTYLGKRGPWQAARRWWRKSEPEWDVVAESLDGSSAVVGEARCHRSLPSLKKLERDAREVEFRALPEPLRGRNVEIVRALFVPALPKGAPARMGSVHLVRGLQ